MPITPFHGGIGLACKGPLGRRFSFTIFVATQVAIDLESAYHLFTHQYPVHRFFHTFLGASLVCLGVAVLLRRPCERLLQVLVKVGLPRWLDVDHRISLAVALQSALVGMLGHVIPDAIMHADSRPLAPFSDANPFLHALSLSTLHLGLVALGVVGIVWLRLASWLK